MRTRVKICGLTRPADAEAASYLGADALGLVFYPPSPRYVEIDQAQAIVQSLPAFVSVVGLFVDAAAERVREVISRVELTLLQFHGDEPAEFCVAFGRPYIKAVRMNSATDLEDVARRHGKARGLLLDADSDRGKGGTGSSFDWTLVPERCSLPIILAGGLHPGNVEGALDRVRPYAVDVSSGVEAAKGVKDVPKMAAFFKAIERFDYGKPIQ